MAVPGTAERTMLAKEESCEGREAEAAMFCLWGSFCWLYYVEEEFLVTLFWSAISLENLGTRTATGICDSEVLAIVAMVRTEGSLNSSYCLTILRVLSSISRRIQKY